MPQLSIKNTGKLFEVKTVYCIGKNYADHINEMKIDGIDNNIPAEPVVFLKPSSSIDVPGNIVKIPVLNGELISNDLQNEVELVIIIGKDGNDIPEGNAYDYILGYAVGIDFTLRDIQTNLKKQGKPWAIAKGFRSSSPVSEIALKVNIPNPDNLQIKLSVNGILKQNGNTSQMIFKIPYLIYYLSSVFGLHAGDIIFTGTPAGVCTLKTGDTINAFINNVGELNVTIG